MYKLGILAASLLIAPALSVGGHANAGASAAGGVLAPLGWSASAAFLHDPVQRDRAQQLRRRTLFQSDAGARTQQPRTEPRGKTEKSKPRKKRITRDDVIRWVHRLSPEYDLDPALVLAVIGVESSFRVNARSPKNARGLMQLMPATAQRFGVKDILDPEQNLRGGMAYLEWLNRRFKGNIKLVLAAYNAGEGAVRRHRGIPPYPETRTYVARVQAAYERARETEGPARG